LRELLARTLDEYHARIIDAAMVVQRVTEMHQEMAGDARRAKLLGLSEDEVAFYDAVAKVAPDVYDDPFLSELIHEVVQAVKRTVRPDWTEPHRNDVRAAVRVAIKGVLRRRGLREADFEPFVDRLQAQAESSFREWPLAA
jgi:type I restriction enzyme R subunit